MKKSPLFMAFLNNLVCFHIVFIIVGFHPTFSCQGNDRLTKDYKPFVSLDNKPIKAYNTWLGNKSCPNPQF